MIGNLILSFKKFSLVDWLKKDFSDLRKFINQEITCIHDYKQNDYSMEHSWVECTKCGRYK